MESLEVRVGAGIVFFRVVVVSFFAVHEVRGVVRVGNENAGGINIPYCAVAGGTLAVGETTLAVLALCTGDVPLPAQGPTEDVAFWMDIVNFLLVEMARCTRTFFARGCPSMSLFSSPIDSAPKDRLSFSRPGV